MIEQPKTFTDVLVETPVFDDYFLLYRDNREFLEGKRLRPIIESIDTVFVGAILFWGVFSFMVLLAVVANASHWSQSSVGVFFFSFSGSLPVILLGLILWKLRIRSHQPANGQILMGEVVRAEKIRVYHGRVKEERFGVKYRFTAPGGIVEEFRAEGDIQHSSDGMAPAPGTPVYVWYDDKGNHYLL